MSRTLLIPDLHQDLGFLAAIGAREDLGGFDRIVLMGDYFDARAEEYDGERATRAAAQALLDLVKKYPRKVRMLWGNHDLIYCRLREYVMRVEMEEIERKTKAAGLFPTFQRARWINEVWPGEMWFRMEMAVLCDDWLISHAGIHPDFWPPGDDPADCLAALQSEWEGVIGNLFENEDHPLVQAGRARGGKHPVGGPLWCDWEAEFIDGLPYRQIVAHSCNLVPRQKGRSWCIDCGQTTYAVIEEGAVSRLKVES